ncbi:MAG: hypothetical protein OXE78_04645 [Gammaproteobacteria bacterium]|nr:hypothetical protein [Gammaproteobacteria bacterium]
MARQLYERTNWLNQCGEPCLAQMRKILSTLAAVSIELVLKADTRTRSSMMHCWHPQGVPRHPGQALKYWVVSELIVDGDKLPQTRVVSVCDREGDIWEMFERQHPLADQAGLLVRNHGSRHHKVVREDGAAAS